jgi:ribonuclease R
MSSKKWALPTREAILELLRQTSAPMSPSQLIEALGTPSHQIDAMHQRILGLERDGLLLPNRKGVLLLADKLDLVAGRVQGHRDGFGFVLPDAGGPDLFLSAQEMLKVMHGDRVLARKIGFDHRGRPEGQVIEVTERANRQLVGRLVNERGLTVVVPEDQRIKHDILIAPADAGLAQPGQVVTVEITTPPTGHGSPLGRIVEVLGEIDDPGMEIEIAVRKFDVPHQFPPETIKASESLPDKVRPTDLRQRVDLRDVPLVTIDGEDARDFDDAVYCEPMPQGGWRLLVAIADVSHYVKSGDAIDLEARLRSTSVYFPRRVIPMLPEKLSNGLCSLNPQVDRLVLVCDAVIDGNGTLEAYQFYNAVMHSAARLTYDEVWSILSGRDMSAVRKRAPLVAHLQNLYDLFKALLGAREARGAIDFDTVETQIVVDASGRIEKIVPRHRNDAHRLIEECMLAANVCAADFIERSRHEALFRVHEGPTPEKLQLLKDFLRLVGLSLSGGATPKPSDYAQLSKAIRARPDADVLQTMMLRSMQQAIYTPENSGHFGLAYEAYTHFTSPIRRYPDLLTHRVIKALLVSKRYSPQPLNTQEAQAAQRPRGPKRNDASNKPAVASRGSDHQVWVQYGLVCSGNERRADDASRDVQAWLKCQYMRERVGEQFAGRISGVAPFGVFVTLQDLYVDGLVHVSELGSEYFQYNDVAHELRGERTGRRFKLNDELHVQVSRVDLEARRIEFRLVERFGMKALASAPVSAPRKAASAKSEATKAARSARKATTKPTAAAKRAGKASPGKPGGKTARRRTKR